MHLGDALNLQWWYRNPPPFCLAFLIFITTNDKQKDSDYSLCHLIKYASIFVCSMAAFWSIIIGGILGVGVLSLFGLSVGIFTLSFVAYSYWTRFVLKLKYEKKI